MSGPAVETRNSISARRLPYRADHDFVWRPALNLAVYRAPTRNRKPFGFWPKLVGVSQPADDFQTHFGHPLTLSRHVQFLDHLIAGGVHFRGESGTTFSPVGVSWNDRPNIATGSQPFPIVTAHCPPTRRLAVLNAI